MNALEQAKRGSSGETTETTKKPEETTKEITTPADSTEETTDKTGREYRGRNNEPEDETGKYY